MTISATIRRVWEPDTENGRYTVVVRDEEDQRTYVLWSRDRWLCSLIYEKFVKNQANRPLVTVTFDFPSKNLTSVALPVAA